VRKSQSEKLDKKRDPGKTIEVLFKISEAVSNTRNLDELYKVIHKSLDKILNVDNFYIALHNEAKDTITFPYHVDENNEILEEIVNFSKKPSSTGILIQNHLYLNKLSGCFCSRNLVWTDTQTSVSFHC